MYQLILNALSFPLSLVTSPAYSPTYLPRCKSSPQSDTWPSHNDWSALNKSIDGCLIRTAPAASSCYDGNPLNSPYNCTEVKERWDLGVFHASWPESISYSVFTNNSCIPPGKTGYTKEKGCSIGGLPQYVVNATKEEQIATAMEWASKRNIRIVIKSTGHDFNGRATGAYSLSIWVHNFWNIEHNSDWRIPGSKDTANVLICGGGNNWGSAYIAANEANRSAVGAEDVTVGIGGQLTNGGHGTLSSYHGLSSDHLYQATVITTEGRRLVVNDEQNQDMFWAIRGAGGGVFGVVTELVIKSNPRPENAVSSALTFYARDSSRPMEDAAWAAFAEIVSQFPDLMDAGVTGTVDTMTGQMAKKYLPLPHAVAGPAVSAKIFAFNTTVESMRHKIRKLVNSIEDVSKGNLSILVTEPYSESFWSWGRPEFRSSNFAGSSRVFSGRLLGRAELSDLRREDLDKYLRQILVAEHPDGGNMLRFDLQAGSGPAKVPKRRWASENWYWRKAYVLAMVWGAHVNATEDPSNALNSAIDWYEENQEAVWRKWAPDAGAYLNAANGFSRSWKHDFYGNKYDKLLKIKEKYDPTESLWSHSGVGSEKWKYDLHSGLLCQAGKS